MTLTIRTPAKLNLGLEVLRRRPDGYHDLATIFQAVDIFDEFQLTPTPTFSYVGDPNIPPDEDIARPIIEQSAAEQGWTSSLRLIKHIPIAAGLGGGSSDAALALRLRHARSPHGPCIDEAAGIGADVPFFLRGGTSLATGVGIRLMPLPTPEIWFVVHTPDIRLERKTATLFQGLVAADFGDGTAITEVAESLSAHREPLPDRLPNAFERQMKQIPAVARAWNLLLGIAGRAALTGAGPSVFSWHRTLEDARALGSEMREAAGGRTFVCAAMPQHRDHDELVAFHRRLTRSVPD